MKKQVIFAEYSKEGVILFTVTLYSEEFKGHANALSWNQ